MKSILFDFKLLKNIWLVVYCNSFLFYKSFSSVWESTQNLFDFGKASPAHAALSNLIHHFNKTMCFNLFVQLKINMTMKIKSWLSAFCALRIIYGGTCAYISHI